MAHDGSIIIDVDVLTKQAEEHLERLRAIGESSGDDISERMKYNANKIADEWEYAGARYKEVVEDMKAVASEIENMKFNIDVEMKKPQAQQDIEGLTSMRADLSKAEVEYSKLNKEAEKLTKNMDYSSVKANELYQNVNKTDDSMKKVSQSSLSVGKSMKSSFKSLTKYAMALFGVRSIYQGLKTLANEWMNSDDIAAQQMKANMEGIKSILVNAIAPVVQFVGDLIMKIVGYISAFLKVFFGINLAAKKAGKTVNKGIGGGMSQAKDDAKELQTILAGFDKADVASINKETSSGGGSGGVGGGEIAFTPELDFSKFDKLMADFKKRLKPFFDTINSIDFKPLEDAFKNLKNVASETLTIIGDSFIRVMNNSVAPFIKILMEDIVPKGLNTVARILKRFNPIIDKLLKKFVEPLINWFLLDFVPVGMNTVYSIMEGLSSIVGTVINIMVEFWDSTLMEGVKFVAWELLKAILETLQIIFDDITEGLEIFNQKLEEGDPLATGLATAIGLIVGGLTAWKLGQMAINTVTAIFNGISPFGWIVIAIGAVVGAIAILYANWDEIVLFFETTLNDIRVWFDEKIEFVKGKWNDFTSAAKKKWDDFISPVKEGIATFKENFSLAIETIQKKFQDFKTKVSNIFNEIGKVWERITSGMKSYIDRIIGNIKGVFNSLINFVKGVFTSNWSQAWSGVVQVFSNIIGGIVNIFRSPINTMIDGLNFFIRQVNKIKIPDWVPAVGGKGINIGEIPHLEKGGVLRQPTLNVAGEYAGAKRNPEIVTPQDIMYDTVRKALEEQGNNGTGEIHLTTQLVVDGRVLKEIQDKIKTKDYMQNNGRLRTA